MKIKFFLIEKIGHRKYEMIIFAYDDDAMSRLQVFGCFPRFQVEEEVAEANERSGHPCSNRSEENVDIRPLSVSGAFH